jgi:hypothetical protein
MHREVAMRSPFAGSRLRLSPADHRTSASIMFVAFALLAACGRSLASYPGQWTSTPLDPGFTEVHMVLLPGDGAPYHSRILTWDEHGNGKEFGWKTGFDGCGTTAWSSFESPSQWTWAPGANIFCAGHAMLGDGTMLSAGGADVIFAWGIRDGRTFQAGTGSSPGIWLSKPLMNRERFYPTVTTLGSGSRALVSGGGRSPQLWVYGGRRDGNPPVSGSGDLLHRLPKGTDALWESPLTPQLGNGLTALPDAREGHTAVRLDNTGVGPAQVVFGGKGTNGATAGNDVFLLTRNTTETTIPGSLLADYTYVWSKLPSQVTPAPSPRSDHIAMANNDRTEMLVHGGIDGSGSPLGDFYRLFFNANNSRWQWATLPTANGPGLRYGHAAVYRTTVVGATTVGKLYVLGGSSTATGAPSDATMYVFTFDNTTFSGGSWSTLTVNGTPPLPRRNHTMVLDPAHGPAILVYGGYLTANTSDAALYELDLSTNTWSTISATGAPAPRQGHAAYYETSYHNGRMTMFGGEPTSAAPLDERAYFIEPFAASPAWLQGPLAQARLSGHTLLIDPQVLNPYARTSEIYDPGAGQVWTEQVNSGWMPPKLSAGWYPVQFLVPGGAGGADRVVRVGQDPLARYIDLAPSGQASGWVDVPNGDAGFQPLTGVEYEPGKILIAGGVMPDPSFPTQPLAVPSVRSLDMAGSGGWQAEPDMVTRFNHNLVTLPTGQVLATGGTSDANDGSFDRVRRPQIWTPGLRATWTDTTQLAPEPALRNYHSTAILLPDARILTGGGHEQNADNQLLHIFCPPYLFKPDGSGLAQRPTIDSAPTTLTWGQVFTVCTANPGAISKVCLIRPAATTHTFDENGRHITLNSSVASEGPARLFVTAPASPAHAPPGDYMLFLVGSTDGPDVPSIAKWVRLQSPVGSDLCDAVAPGTINVQPDVVGSTSIYLSWNATADDGILAPSGPEKQFYLRKSLFPITNENAWLFAGPVPGVPPPGPYGTAHDVTVNDLFPCTTYHFSLRAEDDHTNLAALPSDLQVKTTCSGGGGGEFSAQRATAEEGGRGVAPAASVTAPGPPLIAETHQLAAGTWRVSLRLATEADGLDAGASNVAVERVLPDGSRDTLGEFTPGANENVLGLCALRESGRVVLPGFAGIERVTARLLHAGQGYVLTGAQHSRLGSLGDAFVAGGGPAELMQGDVLDLTYQTAADTLDDVASWYALVRRVGGGNPVPFSNRRPLAEPIPERFSLRACEPNPSAIAARIPFDLPQESVVHLDVFDLLGRHVATVAGRSFPAGRHRATWDLRDDAGVAVKPGVYVCRMIAGTFRAQRKVGVLP